MTIAKTARMKCTRYIGGLKPAASGADPARLPPLAPPENRDVDAAAEWLAHVQAGRIAARQE